MADFDLRTTDIPTGVSVIEASAGTGKTWTISHLVPRLLVDGVVSGIGDVLLVTFTEDAARELGERARRQLAALVGHAGSGTEPAENEPGIRLLLDRLRALPSPERSAAVVRLRLALDECDQLAVSTIHSFCMQVLGSEGFLCGMPAGSEVLPDPGDLKLDAVEDTWRADLAADSLLASVAARGKWSVEKDLKAWQLLTQRPSTRMAPEPPSLQDARDQLARALEAVHEARTDIRRLQEIAGRDNVSLNQFGPEPGHGFSGEFGRLARGAGDAGPGAASGGDLSGGRETGECEILVSPARHGWARPPRTRRARCRSRPRASAVEESIRATGWAWLAHLSRGCWETIRAQPPPQQRRHLRRTDSAPPSRALRRAQPRGPRPAPVGEVEGGPD